MFLGQFIDFQMDLLLEHSRRSLLHTNLLALGKLKRLASIGARRDLGTRSKSDNVPDNVYPIVNDSKSKYADPDVLKIIENFKTAIKSCKTKFESKCPF
ncbi:hypothetical protein LBK6_13385 [Leptospira borgpetersenii serovar Hardjo]|nr:hypothetical protein LBK6_13385 [Leptospira borgpetersenii serovar Hardjo]AMX62510.1 hypothetical protein LBK9_13290 [Leptospira borgpetersenii serovar Hardjo]AMX65752.1 hypothetical protein LBK30_13305 [Leptospira borgpetersenii serovar Hardjo]AMX68985.1 hypothetical protein LBHA_13260 [Leptospira borgpetersenii serovar Hardjo]AWV71017.1 hypothetical protein B9T54_14335 [Leptospira borgpetersenii serovar Hardjo-bovis]